jgi:hypothetical protein
MNGLATSHPDLLVYIQVGAKRPPQFHHATLAVGYPRRTALSH